MVVGLLHTIVHSHPFSYMKPGVYINHVPLFQRLRSYLIHVYIYDPLVYIYIHNNYIDDL